jgi:hypothetical protein
VVINWPAPYFPAVNLWNFPLISKDYMSRNIELSLTEDQYQCVIAILEREEPGIIMDGIINEKFRKQATELTAAINKPRWCD